MDYKELLRKYVQLIGEVEGTIYMTAMERAGFTSKEMAEIQFLSYQTKAE